MRIRILITILIFGSFFASLAQVAPRVSCNLQKAEFEDFVRLAEKQSGVTFYYKQEWTEKIEVNLPPDTIELTLAVNKVLLGSGLDFRYILPDRLVILKERPPVMYVEHLTEDGSDQGILADNDREQDNDGRYMEVSRPEQIL